MRAADRSSPIPSPVPWTPCGRSRSQCKSILDEVSSGISELNFISARICGFLRLVRRIFSLCDGRENSKNASRITQFAVLLCRELRFNSPSAEMLFSCGIHTGIDQCESDTWRYEIPIPLLCSRSLVATMPVNSRSGSREDSIN